MKVKWEMGSEKCKLDLLLPPPGSGRPQLAHAFVFEGAATEQRPILYIVIGWTPDNQQVEALAFGSGKGVLMPERVTLSPNVNVRQVMITEVAIDRLNK